MNHEISQGEFADTCTVCRAPIKDLTHAVTKEYMGKLLTFCSEKCLKQYFDDPAMFATFEDDEVLE